MFHNEMHNTSEARSKVAFGLYVGLVLVHLPTKQLLLYLLSISMDTACDAEVVSSILPRRPTSLIAGQQASAVSSLERWPELGVLYKVIV